MLSLIGYTNRLSARAGETIEFKVSSLSRDPYHARLVRVICADPNPAGPGLIENPVASELEGSYPSREQSFSPGSYALIKTAAPLPSMDSFTLVADIWPTAVGEGEQAIMCLGAGTESLARLSLDSTGSIEGRVGSAKVSTGSALINRRWYRVFLTLDADAGEFRVGSLPLSDGVASESAMTMDTYADTSAVDRILFANDTARQLYNGKIDSPRIFDRAFTAEALSADTPLDPPVAAWDFSRGISTTRIEDTGALALHGELINLPACAMTGARWDGTEMCWRHAPGQYGAIHFHEDDIYDFGWKTDFSFTIPEDLPCGVYAARIECGDHYDAMPFFVCAPRGKPRASLCVLVSTFTYTIYGNHARPDYRPAWKGRIDDWNAYPHNAAEYPEYGLSTYNFHRDGSGICHASYQRPLLTLRPGYITFCAGTDSGLRHFQADSHLLTWLESKGYDYDLITDQELHDEGVEVLQPYKTVMTGSHPEYHTRETLDALQGYRDQGGALMYMGGNGFYWRIALHPDEPGILEIRRGEGGIRAWAAEPGEYYNAFDGNYGGLWRRSGRAPQVLAGVGFSAQGTFVGSYYRRNPDTYDDTVFWVFDGVSDEVLGDFGLCGGGAAGFELDRVDECLGSPPSVRILASSENHTDDFIVVPEEMLTHLTNWPGEPMEKLIRADMVYFETPAGGRVFSTGSITFCGSLLHNDGDNNISRIVANVLDRFLA